MSKSRIQQQITAFNQAEDDAPASIDRGGGDQSEATHFYFQYGRVGRRYYRWVSGPDFAAFRWLTIMLVVLVQ
jgi:predicted metal-dependent HD superfamily phosphohydrolase